MMDPRALAVERFGAAGVPKFYTSHWSLFSRKAVTVPSWAGLSVPVVRFPRMEALPSASPPSHPGEEDPWSGASFAPPGAARRTGPGVAAAARGPREEGIKDSHVGPAFISGFKEVQTNSVPVPGGSSSLLEAPACSLPPSCSFLESQQSLSPRGTPQGPLTHGHKGGKGTLC